MILYECNVIQESETCDQMKTKWPQHINTRECYQLSTQTENTSSTDDKLEMWANAQRDGRPAKYRWRRLFNAAKFG